MTTRAEDEPRVLLFVDILGFEAITREIRARVEDYPPDERGFTGSGTTELQGRFVRFSNVLDRHVFQEGFSGGVQAMLFSDCAFLVYENALRAALAAAGLMRAFISLAACRCASGWARARFTTWNTRRARRQISHAW